MLDEAFCSLDYVTRLKITDDIYNIIKKEKLTTIMVTHDIAEALSLSDRIVVLSKRPSTIKKIYKIELLDSNIPSNKRKDKNFNYYYDLLWRDLND